MTAPDPQPPAAPDMWWAQHQGQNAVLVRDPGGVPPLLLFINGLFQLPADAVRLVPEPAVPGPDALRAFADDIEQRMPTLRDPDPLSDWSLGVVWAVDRARNMADAASAALAGTTTPDHDPLADELLDLARRVESEAEIAARPGQLDRLDAIANRLRALTGLQREAASTPTVEESTS